jgi:hypothetical protein
MPLSLPKTLSDDECDDVAQEMQYEGAVLRVDRAQFRAFLRAWVEIDFYEYTALDQFKGQHKLAKKDLQKMVAHFAKLSSALDEFIEEYGHEDLARFITFTGGPASNWREEARNAQSKIDELKSVLAAWNANGTRYLRILKSKVGQPRNLTADLMLLDLAEIYKWATGIEPTRIVDRYDGSETGGFYKFSVTLWRILFGDEKGLANAMKRWEKHKDTEKSAVITNMRLRAAAWGLFE